MATADRACAPACPPVRDTPARARRSVAGSRRRKPSLRLPVALAAVVATVPGALAGAASASPPSRARHSASPTSASVAAQVRALQHQADDLVEAYDHATVGLTAAGRRAAAAAASANAAERRTVALRRTLGVLVSAAYQSGSGGVGAVATLLNSEDPQHFLDRASSLSAAAHDQQARFDQYEKTRAAFRAAQAKAAADSAESRRLQLGLAGRRKQIESSLVQQEQLLGRLSPGLRQALISSRSTSVPLASIPATGRAAVAIRFAYAQLGKPYRWGAAGPGAYDCSGLTMTAWHASGVSLPHSAQAQFASRPHVATGALRPGDLVFFGSPIHHVGLYIGGGNMIAAPHTGDVVKIQPAIRGGFTGASRPG